MTASSNDQRSESRSFEERVAEARAFRGGWARGFRAGVEAAARLLDRHVWSADHLRDAIRALQPSQGRPQDRSDWLDITCLACGAGNAVRNDSGPWKCGKCGVQLSPERLARAPVAPPTPPQPS
jgi:hypothetical protein